MFPHAARRNDDEYASHRMKHDGQTRQHKGEEDLLKHVLIMWRGKGDVGPLLSSHGAHAFGSAASQLGQLLPKTREFPHLAKLHDYAGYAAHAGQSVIADCDCR